jgi:DNA repair exonuclease SbcCD ATPase subunit
MPRENSESNDAEGSGSGMKIVAVILALVAGLTGYALYNSKGAAVQQAETDAKSIASLSNQVNELRTKLALETGMQGIVQSNHQFALTRRTAELIGTSNRLVQTALLLSNAQYEAHLAQSQLPPQAAAIATLEAHRDQLLRELTVVPALQREIADLKDRNQQALFAQAAQQEVLSRLRTEKAGLERLLEDPAFLRLQANRSEDAIELRQRAAANRRTRSTDPRVRLDLQPDGTVRPATAAASVGK